MTPEKKMKAIRATSIMNNDIDRPYPELHGKSSEDTPATAKPIKEDLLNMLDIAYELEGVLHLALTRVDDMPEALPRIIRGKVQELFEWLPEEDYALGEKPAQEGLEDYEAESKDTQDLTANHAEDDTHLDCRHDNPKEYNIIDNDHADYNSIGDDHTDYNGIDEDYDALEEEKMQAPEDIIDNDRHHTDATVSDKNPPAFSLNDRFLFTRELFNGSRKKFDEALDRLAIFDSMEEAEAYFYDDCAFDPSEETVIDFMHIVEGYLKNQ